MNLGQLRTKVKLFANVNASQLNDDIGDPDWNTIINDAYRQVWTRVRAQISRASLLTSIDLPWPAGAVTYTLPANLQNAVIYDIWQVEPSTGVPLVQFGGFFETRNVLRLPVWPLGNQGFTMRIYYIPDIEEMSGDSQEPALIPPTHHDVLVWEALKVYKIIADKDYPESWQDRLEDIEFSLVKELSTRPVAQRSNILLAQAPMGRPGVVGFLSP